MGVHALRAKALKALQRLKRVSSDCPRALANANHRGDHLEVTALLVAISTRVLLQKVRVLAFYKLEHRFIVLT